MSRVLGRWTIIEIELIDLYLQEIGKVDLLTPDQEKEFIASILSGDRAAFEQLIKSNLRYVLMVARQYCGKGLFLGDLINEGNVGLIEAVQNLENKDNQGSFIAYAVEWIRNRILLALAQNVYSVMRPFPQTLLQETTLVSDQLAQKHQREPSVDELAEVLEITQAELAQIVWWQNQNAIVSLSSEKSELLKTLEQKNIETPYAGVTRTFSEKYIKHLLTPLEAKVVILYFGLNGIPAFTYEEISEKLALTYQQVQRIKTKALLRLRQNARIKELKPSLR